MRGCAVYCCSPSIAPPFWIDELQGGGVDAHTGLFLRSAWEGYMCLSALKYLHWNRLKNHHKIIHWPIDIIENLYEMNLLYTS